MAETLKDNGSGETPLYDQFDRVAVDNDLPTRADYAVAREANEELRKKQEREEQGAEAMVEAVAEQAKAIDDLEDRQVELNERIQQYDTLIKSMHQELQSLRKADDDNSQRMAELRQLMVGYSDQLNQLRRQSRDEPANSAMEMRNGSNKALSAEEQREREVDAIMDMPAEGFAEAYKQANQGGYIRVRHNAEPPKAEQAEAEPRSESFQAIDKPEDVESSGAAADAASAETQPEPDKPQSTANMDSAERARVINERVPEVRIERNKKEIEDIKKANMEKAREAERIQDKARREALAEGLNKQPNADLLKAAITLSAKGVDLGKVLTPEQSKEAVDYLAKLTAVYGLRSDDTINDETFRESLLDNGKNDKEIFEKLFTSSKIDEQTFKNLLANTEKFRDPNNQHDAAWQALNDWNKIINKPVTTDRQELRGALEQINKYAEAKGPLGFIMRKSEMRRLQKEIDAPYTDLPSYHKAVALRNGYDRRDDASTGKTGWAKKDIEWNKNTYRPVIEKMARELGDSMRAKGASQEEITNAVARFSIDWGLTAYNWDKDDHKYASPSLMSRIRARFDRHNKANGTSAESEQRPAGKHFKVIEGGKNSAEAKEALRKRSLRSRIGRAAAIATLTVLTVNNVGSSVANIFAPDTAAAESKNDDHKAHLDRLQNLAEQRQQAQHDVDNQAEVVVSDTEADTYTADNVPDADYHMWGTRNADGTYNTGDKHSPTSFTGEVDITNADTMRSHMMEACVSTPEQASIFASQLLSQDQLNQFGFTDINQFADQLLKNKQLRADTLNALADAMDNDNTSYQVTNVSGMFNNYGILRQDDGSFVLLSTPQDITGRPVIRVQNGDKLLLVLADCDNVIEGMSIGQKEGVNYSIDTNQMDQIINRTYDQGGGETPATATNGGGQTDNGGGGDTNDKTTNETDKDTGKDQDQEKPGEDQPGENGGTDQPGENGGGEDQPEDKPGQQEEYYEPKHLSKVNKDFQNDTLTQANDNPGNTNNPQGKTELQTPGGNQLDDIEQTAQDWVNSQQQATQEAQKPNTSAGETAVTNSTTQPQQHVVSGSGQTVETTGGSTITGQQGTQSKQNATVTPETAPSHQKTAGSAVHASGTTESGETVDLTQGVHAGMPSLPQ